ncbi:MAG: FAD-dependent oxidoreductase [Cyanobacteria bacterium HKST-UBA03]|nr:FAD-dependent oxidoreductase [Cyanobacteria bacterium HKST-UBA03]
MSLQPVLVVGGGIAGLVAALTLKKKNPQLPVVIVERADAPGGLLQSKDYGEYGRFDMGAHMWHETGLAELDEWLLGLLPRQDWTTPDGFVRERPGMYANGTLQTNAAFIDLRNLPHDHYKACMGDLMAHLNTAYAQSEPEVEDSAYEYLLRRFGATITRTVMAPAIEKVFDRPLIQLHPMALSFFNLGKVLAFDASIVHDLLQSDVLRQRFGYSDQTQLPKTLVEGRRLFYPKHGGMQRLIDALVDQLKQLGVEIWTDAAVSAVTYAHGRIAQVTIDRQSLNGHNRHHREMLAPAHVVWSAGVHPLCSLLGLNLEVDYFDRAPKTVLVNLLLEKPVAAGQQLFYVYCTEPGFATYRVVNYPAFCPDAIRDAGYPMTVELFLPELQTHDHQAVAAQAIDELRRMGMVGADTSVRFSAVEVLKQGFPLPSMTNINLTECRRQRINSLGLANLTMIGILAEPQLFFQPDVIRDTYRKLVDFVDPAPHAFSAGMHDAEPTQTDSGYAPSWA